MLHVPQGLQLPEAALGGLPLSLQSGQAPVEGVHRRADLLRPLPDGGLSRLFSGRLGAQGLGRTLQRLDA